MREQIWTYLWVAMEYLGAAILFGGFSERRSKGILFGGIFISCVLVNGALLNGIEQATYIKGILAIGFYTAFHFLEYQKVGPFSLLLAIYYYGLTCSMDNLFFTGAILAGNMDERFAVPGKILSFATFATVILVCLILRGHRVAHGKNPVNWGWYTVPASLSFMGVVLIFYYGISFQQGKILQGPLFVTAFFLAGIQIAAMFLVSWMEQNARSREKAISLQIQGEAQKKSIEALEVAYAEQRKLTHDFQNHLEVLEGLLSEGKEGNESSRNYLRDLRERQADRFLLVNSRNAALDVILNQKALLAENRKEDIQFRVNDLSYLKINQADLTIVIGNVLDNAIEACEKLPEVKRQILVKLILDGDTLYFSVRNTCQPVTITQGQQLPSTKGGGSRHGYGLNNVKTVLQKYGALCSIRYEDGWFCFSTELSNTVIS